MGQELKKIIDALKNVDFLQLRKNFKPQKYHDNSIYPTKIWQDKNFIDTMESTLNDLIVFYKTALTNNNNVIVSIY